MRWLLMIVAVICLLGAWWTASALWFGLVLALGVVAAIAAALAFAQARIEGHAQPEWISDRDIESLKTAVRNGAAKGAGGKADDKYAGGKGPRSSIHE